MFGPDVSTKSPTPLIASDAGVSTVAASRTSPLVPSNAGPKQVGWQPRFFHNSEIQQRPGAAVQP